jgi:hypothetical protein
MNLLFIYEIEDNITECDKYFLFCHRRVYVTTLREKAENVWNVGQDLDKM